MPHSKDPDTSGDHSAEGAPWWPDFVASFGEVSLRELARRYKTNPRRLRRAAQRSGLTDEPEVIRGNLYRLGQDTDAVVAAELGVSREAIQGARRRRAIDPFGQAAPTPAVAQPEDSAPGPAALQPPRTTPKDRRRRRFEPAAEIVVVRKGTNQVQVMDPQAPAPLAEVPDLPAAPALPEPVRQGGEAPPRRRRRIVKSEERPELGDLPPVVPRPRRAAVKPPPVTIVFDRKASEAAAEADLPAPAVAVASAAATPAPVVQALPTRTLSPEVAATAAPSVRVTAAAAAETETEAETDPRSLWTATISSARGPQDLYILAMDLVSAAHRAAAEGTVLSLSAVATL